MNSIKNLKIRDKLLILLVLLLIPLFYFVVSTVRREIEENNRIEQETVQLTESEKISDLIHAFQKERARILAASQGNTAFLLEAQSLRRQTDVVKRELDSFLESSGHAFSDLAMLNELQKYRNDVDRNQLNVIEFRDYSSMLLESMLDRMDENAIGSSNVELSRKLSSFRYLVGAKVQLGRIRSLMMNVIESGSFTYENYASFTSYLNLYNQNLSDFNRYASREAAKDVQDIISSANHRDIAGLMHAIQINPQTDLSTYNAVAVFNGFSASIEEFARVENLLVSRIRSQLDEEQDQTQQNMVVMIGSLVLILVLATLLSFYIVNLISTSLSSLRTAADRIRVGATDVTIPINSRDEIGEVAESFRGVLKRSASLTRVAQAIGEGNYDVEVPVQGPEDSLSYAMKDMKDNLHRFTVENENRSWILTGVSELNNLITGDTSLETVAEKVVSFLCAYTKSEVGIMFFNSDGGILEPAASYGIKNSTNELESFKVGAGKIGQAVSEQQVKVLEGVTDEHMKIHTGLAEIDPSTIIILPLQFASAVVGAIELGARHRYDQLELKFFEAVSERIAVMVHTLKAHLQTQELLYETQNQAEELETQQEELRQLNAELKASEEELRVNQEELQEKNSELEEKAQQLEEQYEALEGKNKALEDAREAIELKIQQVETVSKYKSDFLANMSHELRTPLNSILILSKLLSDDPDKTLSTKQIDHAQIIHRSGNDLLKLINEILDLSKIESGMIKLEMDEVKLEDIKLEPVFRELALKKNIRFSEHYTPGRLDTITTDRFRLEQILKNFLSNAIKFTEEGGEVELSIYSVTQKPKFRSEQLNEQADIVAFAVRDTGIGIPKDKQELVFEAFQQEDSSTTRKYGGTGLGLTINKELAALLGGELLLESEQGVGSTFTLYLPQVPAQQIEKAPVKAPSAPEKNKITSVSQAFEAIESNGKQDTSVLIIEDDKGFSDILADFAQAKNFKVHQAYTGNDGLQLATEQKPDAILLDINLPDISGWDVLKQIREDNDLRHVNVHVMSAYDKEVIGDFQENEEYLPKPVTLEMLNKAFSSISGSSDKSIEKILIVEDNEIENRAVAELLLAHGLKSSSAFSAEEAEQKLAKQRVDCIILDLNLPGMKGYEWMQRIKSKKGQADIPIIVYSGKDLSEEEEAKLKEFANTIIIKNEYSYLRLLDEVQLFLHKVNQKLPLGKDFKMKLHVPEEVLHSKKVLVVDDDVRNVYSLSSLLELHGMEVVVAYDGKEAIEKLQEEKGIDMVLMDIMMPEMDGIEAIKQIRGNLRLTQLPIIALTAKAMKGDRENCIKAGASDYIPKPVDTDKLLTLMRVWLYES
ncbi:response regulator [Pontibacter silvestris]|uniref:histidine kinase n=1 Tax=Pontibacter silvestris TaxID=2305183 RepID=A0ABW4X1P2_9BACT|nr:response regulator [Pontibacter silvestris]MCC9135105.1 response regulator [Pontibacter silvestris]